MGGIPTVLGYLFRCFEARWLGILDSLGILRSVPAVLFHRVPLVSNSPCCQSSAVPASYRVRAARRRYSQAMSAQAGSAG